MRKQLILSALFSAAFSASAFAAAPDDAWLAWAGCWKADGDTSGKALCIVPSDDGVRMLTIVGKNIESESRIVASGLPRSITQEGCSGSETAVWSADRQRVFLNAQLNCGNNVSRKVSGMFVMLTPSQWASIQSISAAGGEPVMHTVRYVEAFPADLPDEVEQAFRDNRLARETVRVAAASRLGLDDVKEAVKIAQPNVVEAWITTTNQEFDLDGKTLIELADAGVPSSVIDALVAVSNPRHFAVREERREERTARGRTPGSCFDSYWADPYDPFFYRGGRYGYGCRGPVWGGGWYPWGGYYGGGTVIVIDRGPITTREKGKVTKAGYKAPRSRDTTSEPSVTSATPSKTSSTTTKSSGSSDTSSGSSGDSGRKAKPRGT